MPDSPPAGSTHHWWTAVVVFAAVLFVASVLPVSGSVPSDTGGTGVSPFDVAHVVGYAVLAGTLARALLVSQGSRPVSTTAHLWLLGATLLAVVAYGVAIEVVQGLLGPRSFGVDDILLNGVGAGLGVAVGLLFRRVLR